MINPCIYISDRFFLDKIYRCRKCSKEFLYVNRCNAHMKTHERKNKCLLCDKVFTSKRYLKEHLQMHTQGKGHANKPIEFNKLRFQKWHINAGFATNLFWGKISWLLMQEYTLKKRRKIQNLFLTCSQKKSFLIANCVRNIIQESNILTCMYSLRNINAMSVIKPSWIRAILFTIKEVILVVKNRQ